MKERITIYIDHDEDDSDYLFMQSWFEKWEGVVRIESHSTGGWEHIWNVEAPQHSVKEIPKDWLCASEWAGIGTN